MKKMFIILLIVLLIGSAFAQNYLIEDCMIYDQEQNTIIYPSFVSLNDRGVYNFFVDDAKPKLVSGFKDSVNVSLWTGTKIKDLWCD